MRIAISGLGVVAATGVGVEANLTSLLQGQSGVGRLNLFASHHAVPVGEVRLKNEELKQLLGLNPNKIVSRTSLLGMLAAREAVEAAQICEGLRVGLVSATSVGGMDLTEQFFPQFISDSASGRIAMVAQHDPKQSTDAIARYCGIEGYRTTISTACSSAANAVIHAARLIRHGVCDVVVAGGCDALSKFTLNGFSSLGILDENPCRPFDQSRAGLNLGEGAGYIVLQREDTCQRTPYAYLQGYANANDAHHQTATSEEGEGAFRAMSEALEMAQLQRVDYINVHGTGTPNNDASEGAALRRIWGDAIPEFSSTKPFTGHTLAAAGGIEAVFGVLSLCEGVVYPNLNFESSDAGLTPCVELKRREIHSVMSNSFGFGGNDSSLIFVK